MASTATPVDLRRWPVFQGAMGLMLKASRRYFLAVLQVSIALNVLYLAPALFSLQIYDRVLQTGSWPTLLFLILVLLVSLATLGLLDRARGRMLALLGLNLEATAADRILAATFHERTGKEQMSVQAMRDFDTVRSAVGGQATLALLDLPFALLFLALCFVIHPWIGTAVMAFAGLLIGITLWNERRQGALLRDSTLASSRNYAAQELESRQSETARGLGMREALIRRAMGRRQRVTQQLMTVGYVNASSSMLLKTVRMLAQSAILALAAALVINREISIGAIFASTVIGGRAFSPFDQLLAAWKQIGLANTAAESLNRMLALEVPEEQRTRLPDPKGAIELEQVGLTLAEDRPAVLRDVSLSIAAGSFVGIVGTSGAGKSSLARLIAGAISPTAGVIRLDGAALADWPPEQRARAIGYMPQELDLFEGTVAQNISRFEQFENHADVSEAVVRAARFAFAHEMILRLPKGYETAIGHGGRGLSVGQRQRIALARALYGNPAVLVLDEPNSQVDFEGEAAIVRLLEHLKSRGVTLIVIAHRQAILRGADRIIGLRDGAVSFDESAEAFAQRSSRVPLGGKPATPLHLAGQAQ